MEKVQFIFAQLKKYQLPHKWAAQYHPQCQFLKKTSRRVCFRAPKNSQTNEKETTDVL